MPSTVTVHRLVALLVGLIVTATTLSGCISSRDTSATLKLTPRARGTVVVLDANAPRPPGTRSLKDALGTSLDDARIVEVATHDDQVRELETAASPEVGIVVVQVIDLARANAPLKALKKSGVVVVCVGEPPKDLDAVDVVVAWDEFSIGEQEVAAVAAVLDKHPGTEFLEGFGGDPDSRSAHARFDGAMFAAYGLVDQNRLKVKSGRMSFQSGAVEKNDVASMLKRLRTTYEVTYRGAELSALIIPDDSTAQPVLGLVRSLRQPPPLLLSSGASEEGIRLLMADRLFSTQYRSPSRMAPMLTRTVTSIQKGESLTYSPRFSKRNRLKGMAAILVSPELITRRNAATVLGPNPVLGPLTRG